MKDNRAGFHDSIIVMTSHDSNVMLLCVCYLQMRSLRSVSDQRNGGSGPRPLRAGDPGPVYSSLFTAEASSRAGTQNPTQPHPRDSAAGLNPHTQQHATNTYVYMYLHKTCPNLQSDVA